MSRTVSFFSLALLILWASSAAFSQSTATLVGDSDTVLSWYPISNIQFDDTGKTIVWKTDSPRLGANGVDGKFLDAPSEWRNDGVPIGTYAYEDREYNLIVKLKGGRSWTIPYSNWKGNRLVAYDETTQRLFYSTTDGKKFTFYSILEGGRDKQTVGKTPWDGARMYHFFVALGGQVFQLNSTTTNFTVKDLAGKIIYNGVRHSADTNFLDNVIEADVHVSPDGKRLRIDNRGERIFVRMSDGTELLHIDEPFYRVAEDDENRYIAFLGNGNESETDLRSYRIKVYTVGDEPGKSTYTWLGQRGTKYDALSTQKRRKQKLDQSTAEYEAEKKRQAAAKAAAAAQTSSSAAASGGSDADARAYKFMKAAENEIQWAAQDMDRAAAQRSQGADKGAWCVLVRRAKEYLDAADYSLTQAALQYSLRYTDSIAAARTRLRNYLPTINNFGCH